MLTPRRLLAALATMASVIALVALPAGANHSWNGYHWARQVNPFSLALGDNVTSTWDSYLRTTSADWSQSAVLDTTVVAGSSNRRCRATAGRVEVCNSTYGNTGWLGIASININGSHITQGTVKVNDTYFNSAPYNTAAWRNLVMCQEVGHTLGLDHQDEDNYNANLGTCMDYTNDPSSNQRPNQHDYDQLASIYAHVDATTTVGQFSLASAAADGGNSPAEWGRPIEVGKDGRPSTYARELGGGRRLITFVIWAL